MKINPLPLFQDLQSNPSHPAKYTKSLFAAFVPMLKGCKTIVDPFGGTGRLSMLLHWYPDTQVFPIELESEWARMNKRTIQGNALYLPFGAGTMDAIYTSPAYGNRMADRLSTPGQKRMSYADQLGRKLHKDNAGAMQWGDRYRDFHAQAWAEARRILKIGGVFVLNIKNHIRGGQEQFVTEWHVRTLESLGFQRTNEIRINTPSMRRGANAEKRIDYESVISFRLND